MCVTVKFLSRSTSQEPTIDNATKLWRQSKYLVQHTSTLELLRLSIGLIHGEARSVGRLYYLSDSTRMGEGQVLMKRIILQNVGLCQGVNSALVHLIAKENTR
jgi:hypothetical protein